MRDVPESNRLDGATARPPHRPRWPDWCWTLLAAAAIRAVALLGYTMLGTDSMHYLAMAEQIESGRGLEAWAHPYRYHPGYPALIAGLHGLLGWGWEPSGVAVSFVAGVLLVLPIHRMAQWAYGREAGLLAGLFAAFHPELVSLSVDVMTESSFLLLQAASMAFLARGIQGRSRWDWIASGVAAAGSLWIRWEGILAGALIGAGGLVAACVESRRARRPVLRPALRAGAALAVMLFLFFPYIRWVHQQTGRWHVTTKGSGSESLSAALRPASADLAGRPVSFNDLQRAFGRAAPWPLVPWMAVGLIAAARRRAWNAPASVALGRGALACAGVAAAHLLARYAVSRRYFLSGTVFFLPLAGSGLSEASAWLAARRPGWRAAARGLTAVALGSLIAVDVAHTVAQARDARAGVREAGAWVLATYGPDRWMMTTQEQAAYYARTWPRGVPGTFDALVREMTASPGRLLVLTESDLESAERAEPAFRARLEAGPLTCVGVFPRRPDPGALRVRVYRAPD